MHDHTCWSCGLGMENLSRPTENGGHPQELARWHPPSGAEEVAGTNKSGLRVSNSLCNDVAKRVLFIPREGNQVSWYSCGPTVYDSAHVGHARTYLSFDIMRRILEDYFGYDVFFVMNVTDVDDKVIKRARQNYLVARYLDNFKGDVQKVSDDMGMAIKNAAEAQQKKIAEVTEAAGEATSSQQKTELSTQVAQEELKLKQVQEAAEEVTRLSKEALAKGGEEGVKMLLPAGRDALATELDKREGSSITDPSIFRAHAARYEKEFFDDMDALGIRRPDALLRVTEYIPEIIAYIEKIIKNGMAYEACGSVYFDTSAFIAQRHRYAKLSPSSVGSTALAAESEADFDTAEKRQKRDFALWKASKPGEPFWPSPWGQGRPGWHIECSAMASDVLGAGIDIHTGGMDLKFPHHDNELAQAEAYHQHQQWVNYFFHTGHLHIEGLKMSKSLKNFITIRQALEKYTAQQIRLLFVLQAWDRGMNFGETAIAETLSREKRIKSFFQNIDVALREAAKSDGEEAWQAPEKELRKALKHMQVTVRERLEDNFDTPGAMFAIDDLITATNKYLQPTECHRPRAVLLQSLAHAVNKILSTFGLSFQESNAGSGTELAPPVLDAFVEYRDKVRTAALGLPAGEVKTALMEECDRVRDSTLLELGVCLEDKAGAGPGCAQASSWKLDDPAVLRQERDARIAKAAEMKLSKAKSKRAALVKEKEKALKDAVAPKDLWQTDDGRAKYSKWDARGVPTHDASGKELSKGMIKNVEKEFKKQQEQHDKLLQKVASNEHFWETLEKDLGELDAEVARLEQK
eukprot:TRINITY_DN11788_c0_g2_i1.p1 TRINITY_DN11788_c0_g2~~TRINITY_DN11788_c0_g2_i1.p1  ORF type:complete len:804 (+),score=187.84 TRINITY_DN11788_c0_g2_i1:329-2740(+)